MSVTVASSGRREFVRVALGTFPHRLEQRGGLVSLRVKRGAVVKGFGRNPKLFQDLGKGVRLTTAQAAHG